MSQSFLPLVGPLKVGKNILCDEFEQMPNAGRKLCKYYLANGSCMKQHLFMCINWLVYKDNAVFVNRIRDGHYIKLGGV